MEISKKELLEITNISYGQLYRWKRKGLIPDSWFIKKSSFTGQETFFPKEEILERITKILELKDLMPLEEIKEYFDGSQFFKMYSKSEILSLFENTHYLKDEVNYFNLISLEIINRNSNLIKYIDDISSKLSEEALELRLFYFIDKDIWIISKSILTCAKYEVIDIQDIVRSVNHKLERGGIIK